VPTFFAYDTMSHVIVPFFGPDGLMSSPFRFALEGAVVGIIVGFLVTRFGREGKETVSR
jgi:hypothetical protein